MNAQILLCTLLLCSCATITPEYGDVEVILCPECPDAYAGFTQCAFYSVDTPTEHTLIDKDNYQGKGIPIWVPGYMHHKFCFNETHVVTGSANPTENGLFYNDNIVVRIESPILANAFYSEYMHLQGIRRPSVSQETVLNGAFWQVLFCPRDNCEEQIIQQLSTAKKSIHFLTFSFTSIPIGDVLLFKHEQELCIRGVVESLGHRQGRYTVFVEAGIPVHVRTGRGVMHHKAFVIDKERVIFGSYNPSANANTRNSETVLFTNDSQVVSALLAEYLRITQDTLC